MTLKGFFITLIVIVSAVGLTASASSLKDEKDDQKAYKRCAKETKGNEDLLSSNVTDINYETITRNDKCLMKCLWDYEKLITEDGTINYTGLRSVLMPKLAKHVDKCDTIMEDDLCEKVYLFYKCIADEDKNK